MKKNIKLLLLFLFTIPLYASYQYFYTNKFYEKVIAIHFIRKQIKYIQKRIQISSDIYETYNVPQNVYVYDILTSYSDHTIFCLKKINFSKLNENTNLMKMFKCKLIR